MNEKDFSNQDQERIILSIKRGTVKFEQEAHAILGKFETASRSRVISVDQTRRTLHGLSLQQQAALDESLTCVEYGLFRAAHVLAWSAFISVLEDKMDSDGLVKVRAVRPGWNWNKFATMRDVRDDITEHQIIETANLVKLINRAEMRTLHGHLSTRNAAAHPSNFNSSLNVSLGYVSDLIDRIAVIQAISY